MSVKIFVDTNVWVYAQNNLEKTKQKKCREMLTLLAQKDQLVISTQVIQEYYNVATSKLGLDKLFVKQTLTLMNVYETIIIQPIQILNAIDIQILHQLSFWDSLIISAAKSANCTILLTEDLSDGQVIGGVEIKSPFTIN